MSRAATDHKTAASVFLAVTGATMLAAYWPVLEKMAIRWHQGDNSYGYLVAPLFVYLLWERRDGFDFTRTEWSWTGVALALPAAILILAGEAGAVETLLYAGLWGGVLAITLALYGPRARDLAFPLLVLIFIIPLPPYINRMITFKLKLLASAMSAEMLRASGVTVLREGNILDLGVGKLQVVDACSGLRYLMSMLLMALLIGHYYGKTRWRRLVLLLLVPPMLVLINALRIYLSGLFVANGRQWLATSTAHDLQGIAFFLLAGLVFYLVARQWDRLRPVSPPAESRPLAGGSRRGQARHRAAAIALLLCVVFAAGGYSLRRIGHIRTAPPRKEFSAFPSHIGPWQAHRHYLPQKILDALWADDYISASFTRSGSPNQIYLLIPFYEYQGTRHTAHAPQSCLLGGGYEMDAVRLRRIPVAGGKRVPVMTMLMSKGERRLLACYFFLQRGRVITNPWWNKWYLFRDALIRKRTDGALVRIEIALTPTQTINDGEAVLTSFLEDLWPVLPAYIPN